MLLFVKKENNKYELSFYRIKICTSHWKFFFEKILILLINDKSAGFIWSFLYNKLKQIFVVSQIHAFEKSV